MGQFIIQMRRLAFRVFTLSSMLTMNLGVHAAARAGSRAYQLVVAGGVAGTVGVVGLVLAAVGVVGAGWPIIALVIAAICVVLFRRHVGR